MTDIDTARKMAELNALSLEQIKKLDKKVLGDIILDLNKNHKVKYADIVKLTGMPLRNHEDILIFYKKLPTYNPQMSKGQKSHTRGHGINKRKFGFGTGKGNWRNY